MRRADLFIVTEAQRRVEAFEQEVENAQRLAHLGKTPGERKGWRYHAAGALLRLAARLEPQHTARHVKTRC